MFLPNTALISRPDLARYPDLLHCRQPLDTGESFRTALLNLHVSHSISGWRPFKPAPPGFLLPVFANLYPFRFTVLALLIVGLSACDSDIKTDTPDNSESQQPDNNGEPQPATGPASQGADNGAFSLQASASTISLVEGADTASVTINIDRSSGHNLPITLAAEGASDSAESGLAWQFDADIVANGESSSTMTLQQRIGSRPIQPQQRVLNVVATDGQNPAISTELILSITPTPRPDIYLLAGQSNMVGFSLPGSRQADPGEADAPEGRILQLNPTGNDPTHFSSAADFSDSDSLAVSDPRYVPALDPLHDGFDVNLAGKANDFIGPALSFAKRALQDTTTDIYLVPAAWADTGFCKRDTNIISGVGWSASSPDDPALSGTLLHDRAIARTNIVIDETGGILRGILWHQGEAEADNMDCANAYEDNMRELVASFRTNIIEDARGSVARGEHSDVPFVVATMSMGSDERGSQLPFDEVKLTVDNVHRNIANVAPFASFVNADDLIPPDYPCGEGSCIHFGAAAYREIGVRYYDQLIGVLN